MGPPFDFRELCVRRSAIFTKFQGNPGNDATVAAISFSEVRNHKEPNQAIKGNEGPQGCD